MFLNINNLAKNSIYAYYASAWIFKKTKNDRTYFFLSRNLCTVIIKITPQINFRCCSESIKCCKTTNKNKHSWIPCRIHRNLKFQYNVIKFYNISVSFLTFRGIRVFFFFNPKIRKWISKLPSRLITKTVNVLKISLKKWMKWRLF